MRSAEWRRIQTTIQVIIPTATSAMIVSSCSCSRWGRFSSATCSSHADARAQSDRDDHPEPHPTERVAAALLGEERRDDADDQRRLQAFPETDDEGGKHVRKVRKP